MLGVAALALGALGGTAFRSVDLLAPPVGAFFGTVSGGVLVDGADGAGGAAAVTAFGGGGACFGVAFAEGMLVGCCMSWGAECSGAGAGASFVSCPSSLSRSTTRGVELALAVAFAAAAVASGLHEGSTFSALHGVSACGSVACAVVRSRFKAGFSCFTGVGAMG